MADIESNPLPDIEPPQDDKPPPLGSAPPEALPVVGYLASLMMTAFATIVAVVVRLPIAPAVASKMETAA